MTRLITALAWIAMLAGAAPAELAPGWGVILDIARNWRPAHWPSGLPYPQISDFDISGGTVTFTVADPDCRDNWIYYFDTPVDTRHFPICTMSYKARNVDTANTLYCLWIDDTTGPANMHGMRPFMTNKIVADGQVHEITSDLRKFKPVGISERMTLAVKTGKPGKARLELIGLRFEIAPDASPQPVKDGKPIALTVTEAAGAGKPIAGATVISNVDWINYRRTATTDDKGVATVTPVATEDGRQIVRVEAAGMFPTDLRIPNSADAAAPLEVKLHKAMQYSGMVTDELGEPIRGATVRLRAPDEWAQAGTVQRGWECALVTDSQGKWTSPHLPDLPSKPLLLFQHPDYASDEAYAQPADAAKLADGSDVHIMGKGVVLSGSVTDRAGKPIAGARVLRGTDSHGPRTNLTSADADGNFAFLPSKPGKVILTIQSTKSAPELLQIDLTPDFKPAEIHLAPAQKLSGKVTDENGKPLKEAVVVAGTWRNNHTLDWWTTTGPGGEFNWYAAPADAVEIIVFKDGYIQQQQTMTAGTPATIKLAPSH